MRLLSCDRSRSACSFTAVTTRGPYNFKFNFFLFKTKKTALLLPQTLYPRMKSSWHRPLGRESSSRSALNLYLLVRVSLRFQERDLTSFRARAVALDLIRSFAQRGAVLVTILFLVLELALKDALQILLPVVRICQTSQRPAKKDDQSVCAR